MLQEARAQGVDEVVIKTAQLDDPQDGHPLLTTQPQHRRYDRDPMSGTMAAPQPLGRLLLEDVAGFCVDVGRTCGAVLF